MKFQVFFKTPDAFEFALKEQMDSHCEDHVEHNPDCHICLLLEETCCENISQIKKIQEKFISFGEGITIEFDTHEGTAIVISIR